MDIWNLDGFEFRGGESDYGYINFEILQTGELEISLCDGFERESRDGRRETRQDDIVLSKERTTEFLAGLQVWLEQL